MSFNSRFLAHLVFKKINNLILDILFPIVCLSCGRGNEWLCPDCFEKIKLLPRQVCPYCEKNETDSGRVCFFCREKFLSKNDAPPLNALVVASSYKDGLISRMVHLYKYNFAHELSWPLGNIMVKILLRNNVLIPDLIIPVPLHARRHRWRGFNQSEILADFIGKNLAPGLDIPVFSDVLERTRHVKPQMKIKSYRKRQENVKKVFAINKKTVGSILFGKRILLVDDITTTGSTLTECARVLKMNGAKSVIGAVIARQDFTKL